MKMIWFQVTFKYEYKIMLAYKILETHYVPWWLAAAPKPNNYNFNKMIMLMFQ